jgi:hypothetical protein
MPANLPTPAPVPTLFESIEARALAVETCVETHLKAVSVAGLTKLNAVIANSGTLPFGLEPYKVEVESFLSDALILAQLAAQLGLITATPATPA